MTERSPWWKAFLPKKKGAGAKDPSVGPDYDPFAKNRQKDPNSTASKTSGNPARSQHESNKGSNHHNDFDYQIEEMIDEQSFRRNMRESRSGRFKMRGKVRSTLHIEEKDREDAAPVDGALTCQ